MFAWLTLGSKGELSQLLHPSQYQRWAFAENILQVSSISEQNMKLLFLWYSNLFKWASSLQSLTTAQIDVLFCPRGRIFRPKFLSASLLARSLLGLLSFSSFPHLISTYLCPGEAEEIFWSYEGSSRDLTS